MRLAAALIALVLTSCAPSAPSAPAVPEISRIETALGVTLYVEKYGDGPDVVIAPGRLFMAEEFRALAAPDRTLILYDMRNRGASSRVEDTSLLTLAGDVRDVEALRTHFGAERISLIGYSYLGVMTALYAAEHPGVVERLVQIGPAPRRWDTEFSPEHTAGEDTLSPEGRAAQAAWADAQQNAVPNTDPHEMCNIQRRFVRYLVVGNPANAKRVSDTCVYENEWPVNFARHIEHHFGDIQQLDLPVERFSALTLPVLIVHGTLDRNAAYGSGQEWARTFRDARLMTVEGGAHNVWLDDANVVPDIDRFLRGEWPARAEAVD